MLERKNASTDNPVDATRKAAFSPLNRYSERFTNKDYYFDRIVVLIFCFLVSPQYHRDPNKKTEPTYRSPVKIFGSIKAKCECF